ncbi:hypothetical protein QP938_05785 [Porticoccaceae bacterium LTM1]|nr:hypothetical protein QP938_05785 [Porticoccaceae bacterium LTM1]
MRYKTVGEILAFSRELHEALSRQYAELEQLTTSERASMLLDYLNRHEHQLSVVMENYGKDIHNGALNTWLQYAPEFNINELTEKVREVDLESVDSIVQTALEVDDFLVRLYTIMAEKADIESVRDFFQSLLKIEDKERHRIARNAYSSNDM